MDWIYWLAGAAVVAVILIMIAVARSGEGGNSPLDDPYDGEGW